MNGSVHNSHTHTHTRISGRINLFNPHMCQSFLTQFPQLSLYHSPTSTTTRRGQLNIGYAMVSVSLSLCQSVSQPIYLPSVYPPLIPFQNGLLRVPYTVSIPRAPTTRHVNFKRAADALLMRKKVMCQLTSDSHCAHAHNTHTQDKMVAQSLTRHSLPPALDCVNDPSKNTKK